MQLPVARTFSTTAVVLDPLGPRLQGHKREGPGGSSLEPSAAGDGLSSMHLRSITHHLLSTGLSSRRRGQTSCNSSELRPAAISLLRGVSRWGPGNAKGGIRLSGCHQGGEGLTKPLRCRYKCHPASSLPSAFHEQSHRHRICPVSQHNLPPRLGHGNETWTPQGGHFTNCLQNSGFSITFGLKTGFCEPNV